MFTSGMTECKYRQRVRLHGLNAATFDRIVSHIYNGTSRLDAHSLLATFYHAEVMAIGSLVDQCTVELSALLEPRNAITVWRFAVFMQHRKLIGAAYAYLLRNFRRVSRYPEFETLDYKEVFITCITYAIALILDGFRIGPRRL